MTTFDPSQHWTSRDFKTSERLRLQHYLAGKHLKFLLHPSIKIKPTSIADVGCANGAWIIDVAEEFPSAQLTGFDLSTNLFPPQEWVPSNIKFKTLDILSLLPTTDQFDVVNARYLTTIFKANNPTPFLTNVAKMIKPGGFLQWIDVLDIRSMRVFVPNERVKKDATERLVQMTREIFSQGGVDQKYLESWESTFGLKIVHQEDIEVPPHLRQGYTETSLHATHEIAPQIPEDKREEYLRLLAEVNDEIVNGVAFYFPTMTLIVAQKV